MITFQKVSQQDFDKHLAEKSKTRLRKIDFSNLTKEDLDKIILSTKRPKDHKKREHHYMAIIKTNNAFLYNGFNKLIQTFKKSELESENSFERRIYRFAVDRFLNCDKERQLGGFYYN